MAQSRSIQTGILDVLSHAPLVVILKGQSAFRDKAHPRARAAIRACANTLFTYLRALSVVKCSLLRWETWFVSP